MQRLWMYLALCSLSGAVFGQAALEASTDPGTARSVAHERIVTTQTKQADLWDTLQAQRVADVEPGRHVVRIDTIDKQWLDADLDDPEASRIVGQELPLDLKVDLAEELAASADKRSSGAIGKLASTKDGMVWTTSLAAPGATALRIEFDPFELPNGVALYLYNEDGQAHGPYTGKGPHDSGRFWSHTVFGEHAWVQLHFNSTDTANLGNIRFGMSQVGHFGERFQLGKQMTQKADCSANVECIENAECYGMHDILDYAREGVAQTVISLGGGWISNCSGGLITDRVASHQRPWFLTANHCMDGGQADSLEAFFQFQAPCGTCNGSSVDSVLGSTLWARGKDADFALLELSELPSEGTLLGWRTDNVEGQVGTDLYRISHPQGQPQSLSQYVVADHNSTKKIYSNTVFGDTEGGSSGAPVVDSDGTLVGVLRGATGGGTACDYDSFLAIDGALSYFYPSIAPFLDPGAEIYSIHVSQLTASNVRVQIGTGELYYPIVEVQVANEMGHPVPRAAVLGTLFGEVNHPLLLVTDENGKANHLLTTPTARPLEYTFCVNALVHPYLTHYDAPSNVAFCSESSVVIPD